MSKGQRQPPARLGNRHIVPLIFMVPAAAWAGLWSMAQIQDTHPYLVTTNQSGPAMMTMCSLTLIADVVVYLVVITATGSTRSVRVLTRIATGVCLTACLMLLFLFVLPHALAGGEKWDGRFSPTYPYPPYSTYPPYSWGMIGEGLKWVAQNVVIPWAPYLTTISWAVVAPVIILYLHVLTKWEKVLCWAALSCIVLIGWVPFKWDALWAFYVS